MKTAFSNKEFCTSRLVLSSSSRTFFTSFPVHSFLFILYTNSRSTTAMFSFRKRPRANSASSAAPLKTSPSLPELSPQGIPWPENLVDVSVLRETPPVPEPHPYQGAAKSSLHSIDHAPIPFHKPFRFHSGQPPEAPNATSNKISSLYPSPHPPSAFENWRSPSSAGTTTRRTQRRGRAPPAFNLMVRSLTLYWLFA